MDAISKKLEYTSEITRDELLKFTDYEHCKEQIDSITGHNNLDFPYDKAEVNEYVIKLTLPYGRQLFLPIFATDGLGCRFDNHAGNATIRRPETELEQKKRIEYENEAKARAEWEAEQRIKNASNLEKAKQLVKKKLDRQRFRGEDEQ